MGAVVTVQYRLGGKTTGEAPGDLKKEDLEKVINILGIRVAAAELPTGDNCRYLLVLEVQDQRIPSENPGKQKKGY